MTPEGAVSQMTKKKPKRKMTKPPREICFVGAGPIVKQKLKESGITATMLAKKLKVHPSSVCRYFTGESRLSDSLIVKIAGVLKVEPTELMLDCLNQMFNGWENSPFGMAMAELAKGSRQAKPK